MLINKCKPKKRLSQHHILYFFQQSWVDTFKLLSSSWLLLHSNTQLRTETHTDTQKGCQTPAPQQKTT